MDSQKKQKVLIGIVAALVLGAGGYWYAARDSGATAATTVGMTSAKRRERTKSTTTAKKTNRRERTKTKAVKKEVKRRERAQTERKTTTRRQRSRTDRKKVKKESMVPAA